MMGHRDTETQSGSLSGTLRSGWKNLFSSLCLCASVANLVACKPQASPAAAAKPASVVAKEGDLITVTLTPEAEARLGIQTAAVELRKVARTRSLGGETVVPPGRDLVVSVPLAGTLGGTPPSPGARLAAGQTVFTLVPLLSAESRASIAGARADAEGAVEVAKVQLDAAKVALGRAEQLLRDKAGSQRAVDEAKAQRESAQAAFKSGESRRDALGAALGTMNVSSPIGGILRKLHAAPGQPVTAGAPLFEVADLDRLWVRVPVFVGDLAAIDGAKETAIEGLAARPVAAPPSADPAAATADLFYEVENKAGALRPGQKVAVSVPLRSEEGSLVIPWSAVIHDVHGGTWVYESVEGHKYVRRRVQLRHVSGGTAALASGPKVGTKVVTQGVAELYGTEFGHAK